MYNIFNEIFHTFIEFLYAPLIYKEMFWILIPLSFSIILMEIYFSKYPREGLGHHKALENSIFLIFVYFDLIRYMLFKEVNFLKFFVIFLFLIFTFIVSIYDFFHKLPLKTIFNLSSKIVIAFFTYITIVLVYSNLLNRTDLIHLFSIFLSIIGFIFLIILVRFLYSYLEPKSYEELEKFLDDIEKDIKNINKKIVIEEEKDERFLKKESLNKKSENKNFKSKKRKK